MSLKDTMNNYIKFKCNSICYYFSEKIRVIKIFEEIHMAKVVFIESTRESIVDISGISKKPVYDVSIPIKLLGGERRNMSTEDHISNVFQGGEL